MPGCSHRGARNPSRRLHAPHRQSEATPLRSRTDLNDAGRRYGKLRIKRERTRTPPSTLSACHTRATCQGAHGVATVTHGQVGADNQERRSRRSAPRLSARTSKLVMRVRFPSPALLFSSWSETFFGVRFRPLCGVFRPGVPHGRADHAPCSPRSGASVGSSLVPPRVADERARRGGTTGVRGIGVEARVASPEPAVGVSTRAGTCPGRLRRHCVIGDAGQNPPAERSGSSRVRGRGPGRADSQADSAGSIPVTRSDMPGPGRRRYLSPGP